MIKLHPSWPFYTDTLLFLKGFTKWKSNVTVQQNNVLHIIITNYSYLTAVGFLFIYLFNGHLFVQTMYIIK